jgi:hypothetical protein
MQCIRYLSPVPPEHIMESKQPCPMTVWTRNHRRIPEGGYDSQGGEHTNLA